MVKVEEDLEGQILTLGISDHLSPPPEPSVQGHLGYEPRGGLVDQQPEEWQGLCL